MLTARRRGTSTVFNASHILFLFMLAAAPAVGCTSDRATEAEQKSTFDVVRDDVPRWLEFAAAEQAHSASLHDELHGAPDDLQALGVRHIDVMRALYGARSHRPAWIDGAALSGRGEALLKVLHAATGEHGLDARDLHEAKIAALVQAAQQTTSSPHAEVRFAAAELKLVTQWASENRDATPEQLARALADPEGPTPRLAAMIAERAGELAVASRDGVRLDLLLTDALVEVGTQMRWANDAWTRDATWPDHLREPAADTRDGWRALRSARRDVVARRELAPLFVGGEAADVTALFGRLQPPYEQYARLTKSYVEYQRFVEAGGWSALSTDAGELKVGSKGDPVVQLKARLAAEGYWAGDRTPRFTPSLADALRAYQRTHQLWEKGTLSRETYLSLNVPAERRLAQIRVALQRWRESNIGADRHYVFVNVPDMHVEVWKDGERQLRMKTVVGATTHERDASTGAFEFTHATPSVSSTIDHVVLNPYWWVPPSIVKSEIDPQLEIDPWYLAKHNYEWAEDDRGEAALRQRPGAGNALGRVKFNFANEHQIYMHDTPEKELFNWPARAFSHGCIRLERPMELAKYLLTHSGQWDDHAVNATLAAGEESWVRLEAPLPVHVEYYVVRVDDHGRANFLSDLYRRDTQRMRTAMQTSADAQLPVSTH